MAHHPCGIQPWGNFLAKGGSNIREKGLGFLSQLKDEQILSIIENLDAKSLVNLSLSSKSFYCFCNSEDLWKQLVLESYLGNFLWAGSWKETYVLTSQREAGIDVKGHGAPEGKSQKGKKRKLSKINEYKRFKNVAKRSRLVVDGFYSDLLYQPWHCATVPIAEDWTSVENIDRRSNLSVEEFRTQYEEPNIPVIITDALKDWDALKKWNFPHMQKVFKDKKVVISNYEMDFENYLRYAGQQQDEMPLYLFDPQFCNSAPQLQNDFHVPAYFREDLFQVLGDKRPDYRWLILGPERSGSSFHIDPNSTSAWNAVVTGAKKWIMFPPNVIPPGVHPSPDGADVATPVSIGEWFLNFYDETRESKVHPLECVVRPGEVIFVPYGWWHLVWNLEPGIAVTQNFVSATNLRHALRFLRSKRSDLVSGCDMDERSSLYDRFYAALSRERPHLIADYEASQAARRHLAEKSNKLSALFGKRGYSASEPRPAPAGGEAKKGEEGRRGEEQPGSAEPPAAAAENVAPLATFSFGFKF